MQRELWRASWGWGRAFKKGKAWKGEPFPSLGSRPCWRRCGGSSRMEITRLPRPEPSRSNPPQCWWATDGQVPRGNGGTNAGMRARVNSVCLGRVARNKLLGCRQQQPTGRSPERVRVRRRKDGVCGVHIGRPQDGSHWAWTRATRSPWSHWGRVSPKVLTHSGRCSTVQQKPETEQKCNCQNQEEKPPSSCKVPPAPSTDKA